MKKKYGGATLPLHLRVIDALGVTHKLILSWGTADTWICVLKLARWACIFSADVKQKSEAARPRVTALCHLYGLSLGPQPITSLYASVDSRPGSRGPSLALSPLQSFDTPRLVSLSIRGVVVDLHHLGIPRWGGGSRSRCRLLLPMCWMSVGTPLAAVSSNQGKRMTRR